MMFHAKYIWITAACSYDKNIKMFLLCTYVIFFYPQGLDPIDPEVMLARFSLCQKHLDKLARTEF